MKQLRNSFQQFEANITLLTKSPRVAKRKKKKSKKVIYLVTTSRRLRADLLCLNISIDYHHVFYEEEKISQKVSNENNETDQQLIRLYIF